MGQIIEKIIYKNCIDCEKQLLSRYSKRCVFCAARLRAKNPDYIKKLSKSAKKRTPNNNFSEVQKMAWKFNLGSKHSEEHKKKIGDAHRGEKSYMWIKDRTKLIARQERNDSAYCGWRLRVYIRDNYKCRIDKNCFGRIIAHHILGWSGFLKLRYNINNGITLCHAHHPKKRAEEKQLIPFFTGIIETKV